MASQLIDTLVLREYLERRNDRVDRRRMEVRLTDRGRSAASAIRTAIDHIDATVARLTTPDEFHGFLAGLVAYRAMAEQSAATPDTSPRRPAARKACGLSHSE